MRPQKPLPRGTTERLEGLLRATQSLDEYRRIQCVYLRSKYHYDAWEIAKLVGLKPQTVRNIHSAYIQAGESALKIRARGGRRKSHLAIEEEEAFLRSFEKAGRLGDIVEISGIHKAFEARVGQRVPRSTIARLLHRHGWRKIEPRPKHPKGQPELVEPFKKNSDRW